MTTTQRSTDLLKRHGFSACVVEQTIRYPERVNGHPTGKMHVFKRDAFNAFDIIAISPKQNGTSYIQTTTTAHQAERLLKIQEIAVVKDILIAKNRVFVHGWKLAGARGERKLWQCTITELTLFRDEGNCAAFATQVVGIDEVVAEKIIVGATCQEAIDFDPF